jgi:hypothetical protein
MTLMTAQASFLIDASWFRVVLIGSQVALVSSVVVLLVIWWIEWRKGSVW